MAEETPSAGGGSIGTARIDVTVNTATMETGIEAAKRKVAGMGTQAAAEFDKANASGQRYAASLLRQAELLGKSRAEQIAYNAQTRIGGELGEQIAKKALAQQAALNAAAGNTGKTVRELQFALRGVPAQITDIFTSLQAGQRPLQVLLQQGGQLKDTFGGIRPAAAALGRTLLGLITPYTLAAGAVVALGAAWAQAEEDASAFNNALIVTGNYAGKTAAQLEGMVDTIAHTADVTEGTAREALQKVAESGRFTGEQFDLVTTAAARMADATGQSIDDTIKKFVDLGKAPVETLLKLNETEHFLTESQLDRVQALKAEGKEQEAAAEAARIYATRLDAVATAAEAARPHLSKMWKEAKEGASAAWEETKKFADFLAAAAEKQQKMPWYQRISPIGGLRSSLSALYGAEPAAPVSVASVAGAVDSDKARSGLKLEEEASKFKDRYLTREQEKKQELAELDKLRAQYSEQEYQNLKKQIDLRFADKGAAKQANFFDQSITGDTHADLTKSIGKEIAGYKAEADQWARSTVAASAYKQTLNDMLDTRQRAIDLQVASIGMGQREIEQQQALIGIDEDYNRKKADLQKRQQNTTSALEKAGYKQQLDDLAKYHDQRIQMELDGFRRAEEARKDAALGARAAIADFGDSANDVAGQTYSVWTNSLQGMTDELADFFTTGKGKWKNFAEDVIKQIAKVRAAQAIAGLAGTFFGNPNTISGYDRATPQQQVAYDISVSGGRASGGPVSGGKLYEVAEGGKPELLTSAGHTYLLMGSDGGQVSPASRAGLTGASGGGSGDIHITVENNGQPVSARAEQSMAPNGDRLIKLILDQAEDRVAQSIATGGKVGKAGQQRYGWQRRGVPVGG